MKCVYPLRHVATALALVFMCANPAGADASPASPDRGLVWLTQVAELTAGEMRGIPTNALKSLAEDGWIQTERGLERSKLMEPNVARNLMGIKFGFQISGRIINIREDDTISTSKTVRFARDIGLVYTDLSTGKRALFARKDVECQLIKRDNGRTDIEIVSYVAGSRAMAHHHDGSAHKDHGQPDPNSGEGGSYTCRDYNGRYGNCVNYSSGTQKYINFIQSDCYWAWYFWGFCFFDHGTNRFCNGTSRNCSWLIGHNNRHHCH